MSPWAVKGLPKRPLGATPTLASDPRLAEDPEVPKIDPGDSKAIKQKL